MKRLAFLFIIGSMLFASKSGLAGIGLTRDINKPSQNKNAAFTILVDKKGRFNDKEMTSKLHEHLPFLNNSTIELLVTRFRLKCQKKMTYVYFNSHEIESYLNFLDLTYMETQAFTRVLGE